MQIIEELWENIAIFEEQEVQAWNSDDPLLEEARTSARMQAYVALMEKEIDKML